MDKKNLLANPVLLKGFITTQLYLQGQTLPEIERRLGLDSGRLSLGAWFATPVQLPGPDDFEFAGYSQVAGHHTMGVYGNNLNKPKTDHEKLAYLHAKMSVIRQWQLQGTGRIIKVIPMIGHSLNMSDDHQYPIGSGIPQWKLIRPVLFYGVSFVNDYPKGKFIC